MQRTPVKEQSEPSKSARLAAISSVAFAGIRPTRSLVLLSFSSLRCAPSFFCASLPLCRPRFFNLPAPTSTADSIAVAIVVVAVTERSTRLQT
jgi:hypothetical protein